MQELIQTLSPLAQNALKPRAPTRIKMMAASAKVPLPPQQMLLMLYLLAQDENPKVAQRATQSYRNQQFNTYFTLLQDDDIIPDILDFTARQCINHTNSDDIIQALLLHKQIPDETLAWLAPQIGGASLDMLVQNQHRQMRSPALVQGLLQNKGVNEANRSKIAEFAIRQGIETGLSEEELAKYITGDLLTQEGTPEEAPIPLEALEPQETEIPLEWIEEAEEEEEEKTSKKNSTGLDPSIPIPKQLMEMSVSEKIKVAMRGNKEIRGILVREKNRLVCTAVMKNPRMTESEVVKIAASRNVSDDVIREITRNREWMKLYQVQVSLVNNPKCPAGIAIKMLKFLQPRDLKNVAHSKNVPSVVKRSATKLYKSRNTRKS